MEINQSLAKRKVLSIMHKLLNTTQVIPFDSEYLKDYGGFQNRYTHSINVENTVYMLINVLEKKQNINIKNPKKIGFSCNLHDVGHTAFGHLGAKTLSECISEYSELFLEKTIVFDDNSNNLKMSESILNSVEDFDFNYVLASIIKYPEKLYPEQKKYLKILKKEIEDEYLYYHPNIDITKIDLPKRTLGCELMDLADEITYTTDDFKDSIKGGFLNETNIENILKEVIKINENNELNEIIDFFKKIKKFIIKKNENEIDSIIESLLLKFINNYEIDLNNFKMLYKSKLLNDVKNIIYKEQYNNFYKNEDLMKEFKKSLKQMSLFIKNFLGNVDFYANLEEESLDIDFRNILIYKNYIQNKKFSNLEEKIIATRDFFGSLNDKTLTDFMYICKKYTKYINFNLESHIINLFKNNSIDLNKNLQEIEIDDKKYIIRLGGNLISSKITEATFFIDSLKDENKVFTISLDDYSIEKNIGSSKTKKFKR